MFTEEEDIQYFVEFPERVTPKNRYCDTTIKLLSNAHKIYVSVKDQKKTLAESNKS